MNTLMEKIKKMESDYVKMFSNIVEDDLKITYTDKTLPDMYTHNFVYYKDKDSLYDYIVKKVNEKTGSFFRLETEYQIDMEFINKLSVKPVVTVYDIYHIKTSDYNQISGNDNCTIIKANDGKALEDGINVDILANQDGMGTEFATKRINRKLLEYKNKDKSIDFYVCYKGDVPIGNIEFAYNNDIVKLEDFDILTDYQRNGFGSSMVKKLLKEAMDNNILDAYLITDSEDTAKKMYKKCGFNKVGEKTELLFQFN